MSEQASSKPKLTPQTAAGKATRKDRLAAEMRKNLAKRKRQQRQKTDEASDQRPDGEGGEGGS